MNFRNRNSITVGSICTDAMYTHSKNLLSKAVTWVFLKGPSSFSSAYTRLVSLIRNCMWWHVSSVLFESSSPAYKLSLPLEREYPSPSPNTVRYIEEASLHFLSPTRRPITRDKSWDSHPTETQRRRRRRRRQPADSPSFRVSARAELLQQ